MSPAEYNKLSDEEKVIHLEGTLETLQNENKELKAQAEAANSKDEVIEELSKKLTASEKVASTVETAVIIDGKDYVVLHGVKLKGDFFSKEDIANNKELALRLYKGKSTAIKVKETPKK